MRKLFFVLAATSLFCATAYAQDDAPSLGDVARQARQQKQKDAPSKTAPNSKDAQTASTANVAAKPAHAGANHVITNEELPAHTVPTTSMSEKSDSAAEPVANTAGNRDAAAGQWKSQIQSLKDAIASLQQRITSEGDSIHYAGGNCVRNCEQWNERQQQKQQEVDSMKTQLEQQRQKLEEAQESARKQGFGSQVYDP